MPFGNELKEMAFAKTSIPRYAFEFLGHRPEHGNWGCDPGHRGGNLGTNERIDD
jgi:hypothetical protein